MTVFMCKPWVISHITTKLLGALLIDGSIAPSPHLHKECCATYKISKITGMDTLLAL